MGRGVPRTIGGRDGHVAVGLVVPDEARVAMRDDDLHLHQHATEDAGEEDDRPEKNMRKQTCFRVRGTLSYAAVVIQCHVINEPEPSLSPDVDVTVEMHAKPDFEAEETRASLSV